MSWQDSNLDTWADRLRFGSRLCMLVNLTALAVFSVWFLVMLLWHVAKFLARTLFSEPW